MLDKITELVVQHKKKIIALVIMGIIFTGIAIYFYYTYVKPRLNPSFVPNKELREHNIDEVELLYFYTNWCPYCKKASKVWEKLKNQYGESGFNGKTIHFKEIDCEKDEKKADEFKIEGYPTIKLVKGDQIIDYDAKPTEKNLKEFLTTSL